MRTLIFLCIFSVLALAFASPVPEDEEEVKFNKRGFLSWVKDRVEDIGKALKNVGQKLKNGVVKLTKFVTKGKKKIGDLITKDGKNFGTFFLKSGTGDALLKIGKVAYQLNKDLVREAKNAFEKQVHNVKFEDVLYKVFPILKADAKDCEQAVGLAFTAAGAGALANVGKPVYSQVCKIRQHIVDTLKDEIKHG